MCVPQELLEGQSCENALRCWLETTSFKKLNLRLAGRKEDIDREEGQSLSQVPPDHKDLRKEVSRTS